MYQITNLKKNYHRTVLNNLNISFHSGKFYALLGRNGSGKSTFMRLLSQQELFEGGDIKYDGASLLSPTLKINHKIAFVGEDIPLPFTESIHKWSLYFNKIHKNYSLEVFEKLISALNVDPQVPFDRLSRGQKAKAFFALEAGKKPAAYILDEITSVLDSGSRLALMRFLDSERQRGALIIMSTNIASELQGYATDLCIIDEGEIKLATPVENLGSLFLKVMATEQDVASKELIKKGFKYIDKNSNLEWSLIVKRSSESTALTLKEDRRNITIHEIATYFTGDF